jgi:hypothetical protein
LNLCQFQSFTKPPSKGPPFARLLKDFTGSYGLSFHIMGIVMAGSGFLCVPLRKINELENGGGGKQQRNEAKDDLEAKSTELQPLDNKNNKMMNG